MHSPNLFIACLQFFISICRSNQKHQNQHQHRIQPTMSTNHLPPRNQKLQEWRHPEKTKLKILNFTELSQICIECAKIAEYALHTQQCQMCKLGMNASTLGRLLATESVPWNSNIRWWNHLTFDQDKILTQSFCNKRLIVLLRICSCLLIGNCLLRCEYLQFSISSAKLAQFRLPSVMSITFTLPPCYDLTKFVFTWNLY